MTANDDPLPDREIGTAVVFPSRILSRPGAQAESLIVPVCAPAVVDVSVNATRSKAASGSCAHVRKHIDGASTIHSVPDRVGGDARRAPPVAVVEVDLEGALALRAELREVPLFVRDSLAPNELGVRVVDVRPRKLPMCDRELERCEVLALEEIVQVGWREGRWLCLHGPIFASAPAVSRFYAGHVPRTISASESRRKCLAVNASLAGVFVSDGKDLEQSPVRGLVMSKARAGIRSRQRSPASERLWFQASTSRTRVRLAASRAHALEGGAALRAEKCLDFAVDFATAP
jgi:hypothetical protein